MAIMTTMTNNTILVLDKNTTKTTNPTKIVFKKGILNMAALLDTCPAMYDFIMAACHEQGYPLPTKNAKPVVDLYTGRIYPQMTMGYYLPSDVTRVVRMVRESIEYRIPFGTCRTYKGSKPMTTDAYGIDIKGHQFMDCGSMDLQVLMGLYAGYCKAQEEKKREEDEKRSLYLTIRQLRNRANMLIQELDKVEEAIKF